MRLLMSTVETQGDVIETYRILLVINLWNSLPLYAMNSISVNSFKTNTDKFRCSQDVYYDYQCDIAGTGDQSVSNK